MHLKIPHLLPLFAILLLESPLPAQSPPSAAVVDHGPLSAGERQAAEEGNEAALARQVDSGYAAWLAETDPAKRKTILEETRFLSAAIRSNRIEIVSAVARGGANRQNVIPIPATSRRVKLTEKVSLNQSDSDSAPSEDLVYRRITENRFEVWSSTDGWLFNGAGKLLHHVKVPRRDGHGRDWYGAFLPNGLWITSDLWDQDQQINCFSSTGQWLWELQGREFSPPFYPGTTEPVKALIGWARSDKEGRGWLVGLGENFSFKTVRVSSGGKWKPVEQSLQWEKVYPRSMGMRMTELGRVVPSDDNSRFMDRESTAHGAFAANPSFGIKDKWSVSIPDGGWNTFGFWPGSYRSYVEAGGPLLWIFNGKGQYQGEIGARYLADSANGRDLLLLLEDSRVLQLTPQLKVAGVRSYIWKTGERARPLANFADLHLGFFKRGEDEVVLANWP